MLNVNKITITQKIIFLGVSAFLGILLMIMTSLMVFGKIKEISQMAANGSFFEKSYHSAMESFHRYRLSHDTGDYGEFSKHIGTMIYLTNGLVVIDDAFNTYNDKDKVLEKVLPSFTNEDAARKTVDLVDALRGRPILNELVSNTSRSLSIIKEIKDLGSQFNSADNAGKQRIVEALVSTNEVMGKQLDEYYDILKRIMDYLSGLAVKLFIVISVFMLAVISIVTVFVVRSLLKPLKHTVEFANAMARGDLASKIEIRKQDELGKVCESLNVMGQGLSQIIKDIKEGTQTLSAASGDMAGISDQMAANSRETSQKTSGVLTSADNMSSTMRLVAEKMDETTRNTEMMASAVEEMTSTIAEIAKSAENARTISIEANGKTQEASVLMGDLGNAANDIGKVIETITDISEQVNLLALNATIEAARAGEAGKGFTVVANEIKELARQTAEATYDIKQKIETIQHTTRTTVAQNQDITEVIEKVNEIISGIAAAVEEQSASTREIANTVVTTSHAIQDMNTHVTDTASEASDIHSAMTDVNSSASHMVENSKKISESSGTLSGLADKLGSMVSRFQV